MHCLHLKGLPIRAGKVWARDSKDINVLSEIGDASSEILNTAERLKADVIAVGCRGLRGIKGMMGSVSRNVIVHSKCSVLIGKVCEPRGSATFDILQRTISIMRGRGNISVPPELFKKKEKNRS